jgi:hypothetical protein
MERDCGVSCDSAPVSIPNKIYPSFSLDLGKFPEFSDLKYKDEIPLSINVYVSGVNVNDYSKMITFEVRSIDVNDADASLSKLTKKVNNEADTSLENLQRK